MDANELKEYIIKEDKIPIILEGLGCHSIKSYNKEYRAALPNKQNTTAISVKKDTLSSRIYTSDKNVKGDIISIAMEISGLEFKDALKRLHDILGLKFSLSLTRIKDKYDPLAVFKNIKSCRHYEIQELKPLSESVLDNSNYLKMPHINLIREGIIPNVQEKFGLMYDTRTERILFPHRHWSTGELLGIIGRTTIEQWDILGIPKYYHLIPYPKSMNLYGLYENYKSIQDKNEVYVYEAEKSTLKRSSKLDFTGVSICSHNLSDEQVRILIGLDVDITIVYDKGISLQHIRSECEKFYGIRNVYYIFDKYNLLKEKESPADAPNKIFDYLKKYKIKYDEKEHIEYLKELDNEDKI